MSLPVLPVIFDCSDEIYTVELNERLHDLYEPVMLILLYISITGKVRFIYTE